MIDIDELRSHAAAELEQWQVPALELTIVQNREVVLAEGFGLRNVERRLPATATTLFHHGSTGKAFTGVLVGTLVDDGLLEWDRPVREYLPDFRVTWTLEYEPLQSSWPLTFLTNADGQVAAVEIPLEPSISPIRFEAIAKETEG